MDLRLRLALFYHRARNWLRAWQARGIYRPPKSADGDDKVDKAMPPHFAATIDGRRYRLAPEDRKFWRAVAANEWERHTFMVLDRCLRTDSVYLDVGAWIGPTVLFAAARCRTVYCIEPDPVSYERLLANLRMNNITNVLPFHGALGVANGPVQIANEKSFGNSKTRVQAAPGATSVTVLAMDIRRLMEGWGIEKIDFMKMDVEGAEFDLMPSLIDFLPRMKPGIHLSLHARLFPKSERREKLAAVVELANRYAFCYDKHLNKIAPEEILGEPFTHHYNAITLTDAEL